MNLAASSFSLLALASLASAQSKPLVLEGDAIPGIGTVVKVRQVSVNDQGDWMAIVHTDLMPADVVLRNGDVFLKTGDPLGAPAGPVTLFQGVEISDSGDVAWVLQMDTPAPRAIAYGTTPVVFQGDASGAPGITPGSPYVAFHQVDLDAHGRILASVTLEDPAIPGASDPALIVFQVDSSGALVSETVLVKKGDAVSGVGGTVVSLASFQEPGLAMNDAGDVVYFGETTEREFVARNSAAIAVEGGQSPIFGRTWESFASVATAIGSNGDVAFGGRMSGPSATDSVLVWNGIKLVQEGDVLDAIAPYALRQHGSLQQGAKQIFVDDAGRVLWYGGWTAPDDTRDEGFFRDHELILQEGVSLAGGARLAEFGGGYEVDASDDGRWLIFTGRLEDDRVGVFLLDLEAAQSQYSGCTPNPGSLKLVGDPVLGSSTTFLLDDGHAFLASAFVAIATELPAGFPPCGLPLGSAGEILIDVAAPNPILVAGPILWGGPPVPFPAWIPDDLTLLGVELFAQGLFVADVPGQPLSLSNGVRLTLGLP